MRSLFTLMLVSAALVVAGCADDTDTTTTAPAATETETAPADDTMDDAAPADDLGTEGP